MGCEVLWWRLGPLGFLPTQEVSTVNSVETTKVTQPASRHGLGPVPSSRHKPARIRLSRARMLVLEALENQPEPCTVAAIALILQQHTNTVREHLDGLVAAGLAQRERRAPDGPGRPSWQYEASTGQVTSSDALEYAGLASALAGQIARSSDDPQAEALAAGRAWGEDLIARGQVTLDDSTAPEVRQAQAQETVVQLLRSLDFDPAPSADGSTVMLRRCPLLEAAYRNPEIVCGVHLGLVRGALTALGASADGTDLRPFAAKGACQLVLDGDGDGDGDAASAPDLDR